MAGPEGDVFCILSSRRGVDSAERRNTERLVGQGFDPTGARGTDRSAPSVAAGPRCGREFAPWMHRDNLWSRVPAC